MTRIVLVAVYSFFMTFILSGIPGRAETVATVWKIPPGAASRVNPQQADTASVNRGRSLFTKYCSTCHGERGRGDGPVALRLITEPPDLTALAAGQTDGELAWKISVGRNPMPKWQDKLSTGEIWDIVNFIRNLQPAED